MLYREFTVYSLSNGDNYNKKEVKGFNLQYCSQGSAKITRQEACGKEKHNLNQFLKNF